MRSVSVAGHCGTQDAELDGPFSLSLIQQLGSAWVRSHVVLAAATNKQADPMIGLPLEAAFS